VSVKNNVKIFMRDLSGRVVPDSVRSGHNVMTTDGADLLTSLVAWNTISDPDVPYTQRRARYVGVGNGSQPEDKNVVALASPLQISSGVYLKELSPSLNVFPSSTSVKVKAEFTSSEVQAPYGVLAIKISEVGLYFDSSPGGVLSVSSPTNTPAFYKKFDPLLKFNGFTLEIEWELVF